ncbi:MAG: SpoIVB peptidase [Clostridia bacterium]|nr:SpoIVB peptidase [Clostridia bacterium]
MKRFMRIVATLLSALLLGWYFSPQVYRVLHLPDVVDPSTELTAPVLAAVSSDAHLVRNSEDERIAETSEQTKNITLFGILPLKNVAVSANQRTVAVGGKAIGVVLKTEGVQIVGFEKIETEMGDVCPAISAGLMEGDMIVAMDGKPIDGSDAFSHICSEAGNSCTLSYLRDGETYTVSLTFASDRNGEKRIGAWVRDSTSGIGTLSFYDPVSGMYAALGHGVTDVDTLKLIAPATGFVTEASIQRIRKGEGDQAGELIGRFSVEPGDAIGTIERNTQFGVSGKLTALSEPSARIMEIAQSGAAHKGDAYILSTVDGSVSAYAVRVIRVDVQSSPETQGMMIEITDPSLLEKTGGIVQGMSGSPLIQDGRLVGVVTHVFLSQPTRGYCIYAEWMAKELLP